jgi:hypothetical protein
MTSSFPRALNFFIDSEASGRAANSLGAGISNFSFVLGVLMLALFILLWVTSFDFVHKRMGNVKWKKLQRWSYVLYATLFIHAIGIQAGSMLNPGRGREAPKPAVEVTAVTADTPDHGNRGNPELQERTDRGGRGDRNAVQPAADNGNRTGEASQAGRGEHRQSPGFADINVGMQTKRYIHIASLLLIFGSYLYFRLRKARLSISRRL